MSVRYIAVSFTIRADDALLSEEGPLSRSVSLVAENIRCL